MSKFNEIITGKQPVLVDFFAEWCGPCKTMMPILKDVKDTLGENVKVIKIDVDKNQGLANRFQVRGVPTLMLFRDGALKWRQSGVVPGQELVKIINESN